MAAAPRLELNWGTVRKASVPELFTAAADSGCELVTLSMPFFQASLNRGIEESAMLAAQRDTGVAVGYLDNAIHGLPGVPDGAPGFSEAEAFRLAEAFGVRTLNITHYQGDPTTPLPALVDAIGTIVERAAGEGLAVIVEFLPGTGIPDLATGLRLVEDIGVGRVALLFDTWHHWRSGGRMADLDALDPRVIGATQFSDMPAERIDTFRTDDPEAIERNARLYQPMSGRLLPGDGALPLAELAAWLQATRPDVPWGAEIFNADLDALPVTEVARRTADALRSLGG